MSVLNKVPRAFYRTEHGLKQGNKPCPGAVIVGYRKRLQRTPVILRSLPV